ncbi:NAD(P)/FAD-dependent oxidoreductase [Ferroacidibacillus organovorans]|uniref:FAD-dependent oxidoreductase n=1 Tax=Ferroacidibacillus organovorans TaxID=1765683 RepID=A0A162UB10_9BACL|nr:NAD(P)/FAD-dependent oxidoreductase [Ferroacidibacillus organovorans]KYP81611.1 FAD-dependent oxidoreductase [Ferroacidibacillus organovorans]OAG94958.1 FAD-dependent oxidoreductase [Ferroacidibacillus organovorans]OPG14964.1 FAD-dependent oxidoreductase [Ferroacidibacillus organovorans]
MSANYDVIIVGAGPAGLYAAYEFTRKAPHAKVLLIDKGVEAKYRHCPIMELKIDKCPPANKIKTYASCWPACGVINGAGGAGSFSDGKFNITSEFGGYLTEYLSSSTVLELIRYVDAINLGHGAPGAITDPTTPAVAMIERRAVAAGLKLLRAQVRHIGTDNNLRLMNEIFAYLEKHIEMRFRSFVEDILVDENHIKGVVLRDGTELRAPNVLLAPGRDGSTWLSELLRRHHVKMTNNQVDIGVRVETTNVVMQEINEHLYEGKFIYHSPSTGLRVRTFCSNPSGHVVVENHTGIMAANGHAYKEPSMGSSNTNFALLVSHRFTEPFNRPNEFARQICTHANELSDGSIIVQRYGDLLKGRRSTRERLAEGFVEPTLKEAVPGDLGLVLPYKTMLALHEMIRALDHVTPGIAQEHTLFYGVEAKFYAARAEVNAHLQTKIEGLYCAGDGPGLTRGIAQAASSGVYVARHITASL